MRLGLGSARICAAYFESLVIQFFDQQVAHRAICSFPGEFARSQNLPADFKNGRLFRYWQQNFIFARRFAQNINLGGVSSGSKIDLT